MAELTVIVKISFTFSRLILISLLLLAASLFLSLLAQYRSSLWASGTWVCFLRFLVDELDPADSGSSSFMVKAFGTKDGVGGDVENEWILR